MEKLINEIIVELSDIVDNCTISKIRDILFIKLNKYNLIKKENSLVLYEEDFNIKVSKTFFASKLVEGKSKKTIEKYKFDLLKLFQAVNKPITEYTSNDIRVFLATYQNSGIKRKSNTTMDNMRKSYSTFFSWCLAEEYITKNPMLKINKIKHDTIKERAYSLGEIESMMLEATHIRDKCILEFLYSTGCRISELCDVNIQDINFNNKTIHILHGKGNKERIVPIDDKLLFYLKKYIKWRDDNHITCEKLFIRLRNKNKGIESNGVRSIIKKIGDKAEVTHAHPHRFRTSRISILLKRGMKIEDVQKIVGHNDINTTVGYNRCDMDIINANYMRIA